jgi:hypothetical protein
MEVRREDGPQGAQLPFEVSDLVHRLGAQPGSEKKIVSLTQVGAMRDAPSDRDMKFKARQTIDLLRPEFEWRARTGPFGCMTVTDALKQGQPKLDVHIFGLIRVISSSRSQQLVKGEIMRYLAELAWAPDAILQNRHLTWRVIDSRKLCVACTVGAVRSEVEFTLDAEGRIASVFTPDRPRKEGASFVERPWRGRFFDYRRHEGRWLPFAGEVGWILQEREFVAWRGRLTGWSLAIVDEAKLGSRRDL